MISIELEVTQKSQRGGRGIYDALSACVAGQRLALAII